VANIKNHHGKFIVVIFEVVNNDWMEANYCHFIVIHDDDNRGQFDFEELVTPYKLQITWKWRMNYLNYTVIG